VAGEAHNIYIYTPTAQRQQKPQPRRKTTQNPTPHAKWRNRAHSNVRVVHRHGNLQHPGFDAASMPTGNIGEGPGCAAPETVWGTHNDGLHAATWVPETPWATIWHSWLANFRPAPRCCCCDGGLTLGGQPSCVQCLCVMGCSLRRQICALPRCGARNHSRKFVPG
jgi:hypothetical protein